MGVVVVVVEAPPFDQDLRVGWVDTCMWVIIVVVAQLFNINHTFRIRFKAKAEVCSDEPIPHQFYINPFMSFLAFCRGEFECICLGSRFTHILESVRTTKAERIFIASEP